MQTKTDAAQRILIVEDNVGALTATVKFLDICGFNVRGTATGAEALSEAQRWQPDAVVLDLGLPDIDGFELQGGLTRMLAGRPVCFVAISGRSDAATVQRAGDAGFIDFLVKPVALDKLKAVLDSTLRSQAQERQ